MHSVEGVFDAGFGGMKGNIVRAMFPFILTLGKAPLPRQAVGRQLLGAPACQRGAPSTPWRCNSSTNCHVTSTKSRSGLTVVRKTRRKRRNRNMMGSFSDVEWTPEGVQERAKLGADWRGSGGSLLIGRVSPPAARIRRGGDQPQVKVRAGAASALLRAKLPVAVHQTLRRSRAVKERLLLSLIIGESPSHHALARYCKVWRRSAVEQATDNTNKRADQYERRPHDSRRGPPVVQRLGYEHHGHHRPRLFSIQGRMGSSRPG